MIPVATLVLATASLIWPVLQASSFVIAPAWADANKNPCSSRSWQLVYWPPNQQCYKIFTRGPCPATQELTFQADRQSAVCRCPENLPLLWKETERCYSRYSRGPCHVNQYIDIADDGSGLPPVCKERQRCEPGWIFWPPDGKCHEMYTQGPCHKGDLLIVNPETTEPYCGCDHILLKQYYNPSLHLCYELMTRGPCENGLLYTYNHTLDMTQCSCSTDLAPHYSPALDQCFELETKGPCGKGQVFSFDTKIGLSRCRCKDKYVYWPGTDACYREFTPGPCKQDQFLVPAGQGGQVGACVENPCPSTDLFFPSDDSKEGEVRGVCHKVGSRGPCPSGELVIFEAYSGKSFRGNCGCSPGYNQNYWPKDGKCYEWYNKGPCQDNFYFKYNRELKSTECTCDSGAGYVYWNETDGCYIPFTQGPCPANSWLIPTDTQLNPDQNKIVTGYQQSLATAPAVPGSQLDIFCECRDGYHFSEENYSCEPIPVINVSGHKFESLWSNVAEYLRQTRGVEMLSTPPPTDKPKSSKLAVLPGRKTTAPPPIILLSHKTPSRQNKVNMKKGRVKIQTQFMRRKKNREN